MGYNSCYTITTGSGNICLGYNSGQNAAGGTSSTLIAGATGGGGLYAIKDVYMGNGMTDAAPYSTVHHASGGSGTNITGADYIVAGGQGTGSGLGGAIRFRTAAAGSTGSTANALTDKVVVPQDGGLLITTQTQPTCDATHRGTFWYVAGATTVKDAVTVCGKDAADVYAWRVIY